MNNLLGKRPHNAQAERRIIGYMLLDPVELDNLDLIPSDFYIEDCRKVYESMVMMYADGKKIDIVTLASELDRNGIMGNSDALIKLAEYTDEGYAVGEPSPYVKIIKDASQRRKIINACEDIIKNTADRHEIGSVLEEMVRVVEIIDQREKTQDTGEWNVSDGMKKVKSKTKKYIETGMPTLDYAVNDLQGGLVSLVTGRSNGGKSTFVEQIVANSVNNGHKTFIIDGESTKESVAENIFLKIVGHEKKYCEYKLVNKRYLPNILPQVREALERWADGNLTILSKHESKLKTSKDLLRYIDKKLANQPQDLLVLDNLMSLLTVTGFGDKYEAQADFLQSICEMAKRHNCHIMLVLHPRKDVGKDSFDMEGISGTADIFNKADIIFSVRREFEEDLVKKGVNGYIDLLKNRKFSDLPTITTNYDYQRNAIVELSEDGKAKRPTYNWEHHLKDVITTWNGHTQEMG